MRSISRLIPVALAGAITLAVACGGDATGPSAAAVTGIAGDGQVAPTGAQLEFPLSLVVLGSSGIPLQGVTVNWTATPTGGASFTPVSSTSDALGTAATTVRLGGIAGEVVIRANVPGVQPVVYHALALDPCTFFAPYTVGTTVNATLAVTDCNRGGFYYDYYQVDVAAQQSLRISMASGSFDTWIDLFHIVGTSGVYMGFDDDVQLGVITNSQLDVILPPDSYIIGANSFNAGSTGPYTMTATVRSANMNGCRAVWVLRGTTVTDGIANTDCPDTVGGTHYYDVARIWLNAGTVVSIAERSTAVNAKMTLYQVDDTQFDQNGNYRRIQVAANDDSSAGNNNSFIAYAVTTTAAYDVFIGTSAAGETGAYTFDVSASTTLGPPPPAVREGGEQSRGSRWAVTAPLPLAPFRSSKHRRD